MILLIRPHTLPIVLTVLALLIAIVGESANELFRYEQDTIQTGEWWRLISGNLAHLGWSHTFLNLMGLALIWSLFWKTYTLKDYSLITLFSGLGVTFGLFFLNPEINWYVGLSGLLHGLFIAGIIGSIRQGEKREFLLLIAIIAKLTWEQISGPLPGTAEMANGPVVVDSHLYGAIAGLACTLIFKPINKR